MASITPEQRKKIVKLLLRNWQRYYGLPLDGRPEFPLGVYGLFVTLYLYHSEGKHMRQMEAKRYLPPVHANTRKALLESLAERGYIAFATDPDDRRAQIVQPTQKLLDLVTADLDAAIDEFAEVGLI
jgi:hypothetical protein